MSETPQAPPTTELALLPKTSQAMMLALGGGDAASLALVISLARQLAQPDLRQQRDSFEMVADPEFFNKLVDVACYAEGLRFYRRGMDRFKFLTFSFIQDALQAALHNLTNPKTGKTAFEEGFDLDKFYFEALGTLPEKEAHEAQFGADPDEYHVSDMARNRGQHKIDWIGKLQVLEQRYPGLVNAIFSSIQQQVMTQQKMADNFKLAMHYNRGEEPMARLGRDIKKAQTNPHASTYDHSKIRAATGSGGGGLNSGLSTARVIGGW